MKLASFTLLDASAIKGSDIRRIHLVISPTFVQLVGRINEQREDTAKLATSQRAAPCVCLPEVVSLSAWKPNRHCQLLCLRYDAAAIARDKQKYIMHMEGTFTNEFDIT